MSHPNVTIRHARHAVHLVLSGALRDIEAQFPNGYRDGEMLEASRRLFDEVLDEIDEWEMHGTKLERMTGLLHDMQAHIGTSPSGEYCRHILSEHDLLP